MNPIDRRSVIPLYYQLTEFLREQIRSGQLLTGDQLPTERDLMEMHHLSRNTVRQALGILAREGLIVRDHGHGTYVANLSGKFHYLLDTFIENSELLRRAGYSPAMKEVSVQRLIPPAVVKDALLLQDGEETICHTKIFLADTRPAMYTRDYLPLKLVSENTAPVGGEGFLDFLERGSQRHVEYVLVDISSVEAVGEIASTFGQAEHSPLLLLEETFLDETRTVPIAFSLNYFNRETLKFRLLAKRG